MLVWSTLGAVWANLRQLQHNLLPSTPNRAHLSSSSCTADSETVAGASTSAGERSPSNNRHQPHPQDGTLSEPYKHPPSCSRLESVNWPIAGQSTVHASKVGALSLGTQASCSSSSCTVVPEPDFVDRILSTISQSFSLSKYNASSSSSPQYCSRKGESSGEPKNVSRSIVAASCPTNCTSSDTTSKCSEEPSLSNNSFTAANSVAAGVVDGECGAGHSCENPLRIAYQAMDLGGGRHHHHCCHQYHPYSDPSLSEPSCPLLIFRESPSSATTASSSLATHASLHTPSHSPYQSTPELDLTSDCASECSALAIDAVTGARLSAVYLAASRRKLISDSSSASGPLPPSCTGNGERCNGRMLAHRGSSGASTPSQSCQASCQPCQLGSVRSHASSTYYYTHRHSHSAVMSHSNSSILGTQGSAASLASRRHRSSYPSMGIRHSISGTLRIGPRIYRGRSSQRCAPKFASFWFIKRLHVCATATMAAFS